MIDRPVSDKNPQISVVIPTIPENSHQEVVKRLQDQETSIPYEVIVVNDSSVDICEARNIGVKESTSEIVCLTDDDCDPPLDWLESINVAFHDEPDLVCVEGPVSGGINYSGTRRYIGCNIAFRRSTAIEVGGFDSSFAGWRDDTEFGWRMERAGSYKYDSRVQMHHPPRPGSSYIHENEMRLKREYPKKYREVMIEDATLSDRLYRHMMRFGIVDMVNRVRYER